MSAVKVYFACLFSIILFILGSVLKAIASVVEVALWLAVRVAVIFGVLVVFSLIATLAKESGGDAGAFMGLVLEWVFVLVIGLVFLGGAAAVLFYVTGIIINLAVTAVRFILRTPIDMCGRGYASCLKIMAAAAGTGGGKRSA